MEYMVYIRRMLQLYRLQIPDKQIKIFSPYLHYLRSRLLFLFLPFLLGFLSKYICHFLSPDCVSCFFGHYLPPCSLLIVVLWCVVLSNCKLSKSCVSPITGYLFLLSFYEMCVITSNSFKRISCPLLWLIGNYPSNFLSCSSWLMQTFFNSQALVWYNFWSWEGHLLIFLGYLLVFFFNIWIPCTLIMMLLLIYVHILLRELWSGKYES